MNNPPQQVSPCSFGSEYSLSDVDMLNSDVTLPGNNNLEFGKGCSEKESEEDCKIEDKGGGDETQF